jgi:hypothetical protein
VWLARAIKLSRTSDFPASRSDCRHASARLIRSRGSPRDRSKVRAGADLGHDLVVLPLRERPQKVAARQQLDDCQSRVRSNSSHEHHLVGWRGRRIEWSDPVWCGRFPSGGDSSRFLPGAGREIGGRPIDELSTSVHHYAR